jgi:hypothetical protein
MRNCVMRDDGVKIEQCNVYLFSCEPLFTPSKMTDMIELRWNIYPTKDGRNGGTHGYALLRIPSADAIKILVLTRGCAQGFCYREGGDNKILWAKTIRNMSNTLKLLQKHGYIDPKQMF